MPPTLPTIFAGASRVVLIDGVPFFARTIHTQRNRNEHIELFSVERARAVAANIVAWATTPTEQHPKVPYTISSDDPDLLSNNQIPAIELAIHITPDLSGYQRYHRYVEIAAAEVVARNEICPANLSPSLAPYEGKKVSVLSASTHKKSGRRSFWVGRAPLWMPHHMELFSRTASVGPMAELEYPGKIELVRDLRLSRHGQYEGQSQYPSAAKGDWYVNLPHIRGR